MSWRPNATLASRQQSAKLRRCIRQWMDDEGVLEVCTPSLSRHATTDPHVPSVCSDDGRFLHTSPEFPMKRLLVADAEEGASKSDIYQIAQVFRAGESGRFHNSEFTLLEWYRLGMDHLELISDTEQLLRTIWSEFGMPWPGLTKRYYGREIKGAALDLFVDEFVLDGFPLDHFTVLLDYPANQAALARIGLDKSGRSVAERFEIYYGRTELANGFHELNDAVEQRARFEADLKQREAMQLRAVPLDTHLIDALSVGLPDCAGIAVGIDRLHMVLCSHTHIDQVLNFNDQRA